MKRHTIKVLGAVLTSMLERLQEIDSLGDKRLKNVQFFNRIDLQITETQVIFTTYWPDGETTKSYGRLNGNVIELGDFEQDTAKHTH